MSPLLGLNVRKTKNNYLKTCRPDQKFLQRSRLKEFAKSRAMRASVVYVPTCQRAKSVPKFHFYVPTCQ